MADGRFRVNSRGADGLAYLQEHANLTLVFTNLANGKSVTLVQSTMGNDIRATDNGDGALTYPTLHAGKVMDGDDGKAIARDTGQFRFELLLDDAGTPQTPPTKGSSISSSSRRPA